MEKNTPLSVNSRRLRDFRLIAFDMDSTLINIECIDEIADACGRKEQVSAITEAAMRGDITDFKESLRMRLALLKGISQVHLDEVIANRLKLNPGAVELIGACHQAGLKVLLVSGGFTYFSNYVKTLLSIEFTRSNELEIIDGVLTGRLVSQSWGEICDGAEKRRAVLEMASFLGIHPSQCIAVGDGANDIPMMGAVGISVAYYAKQKVQEVASICINSGGLDNILQYFDI